MAYSEGRSGLVNNSASLIFLALIISLLQSAAGQPFQDNCDDLAELKAVKDAMINRSEISSQPGVIKNAGVLISTGGSFKSHPVDQPCDQAQEFGPFEVASGGKLEASIESDTHVPNTWSLHNTNTGITIFYEPKYGSGYGPVENILSLSGNTISSEQENTPYKMTGTAEWSGPGRLSVSVGAPKGSGPLSGSCYEQSYSAKVDIISFKKETAALAGTTLKPGDLIKTASSGGVAAILNNGGKILQGPDSSISIAASGVAETSVSPPSKENDATEVKKKLDELYDQGWPTPVKYEFDKESFVSSFRSNTFSEALGIINSEKDPCKLAVELKLFFDSHQGELSLGLAKDSAYISGMTLATSSLLKSLGFSAFECVIYGIPINLVLGAGAVKLSSKVYYEIIDWMAGNEAKVAFDIFRGSMSWTRQDFEANAQDLSKNFKSIQKEIDGLPDKHNKDLQDKFIQTAKRLPGFDRSTDQEIIEIYKEHIKYADSVVLVREGAIIEGYFDRRDPMGPYFEGSNADARRRLLDFDKYYKERHLRYEYELKQLTKKQAAEFFKIDTLMKYRFPIIMGKCEELKRQRVSVRPVPIEEVCESAAKAILHGGILRYSSDKSFVENGLKIEIDSYTVTPKGTEVICEKRGDSSRVAVIEGNATISNATVPAIELHAGQQIDLQTGAISPYNLSIDDGGLVLGIPLRDLPLDDALGQPYGLYFPFFSNNTTPTDWIWQDPDTDAIIETPEPGTLKVTVPDGNDLWGSPGSTAAQISTAPRLLHKVTGDFDLEGELQLQCNSSDYAATEFVIYSPGSYLGFLEPQQMKLDGLGEHYRVMGGGWVRSAGLNKLSTLSWLPPQNIYEYANLRNAQDAPNGSVLVKLIRRGDTWKTYWSLDGSRWNLSGRQEIEAPDTLWVGWVFKRLERGWLADEKATTTLKDVRLETAPLGSKAASEWDLIQMQGAALPADGSVQLSLNESERGVATAYMGQQIEGDFDAVLRFDAQNWTHQPDQCRQLSLIAEMDGKHKVYVGLYQSDDRSGLRRYATGIMLNGGWYYSDWDEAPAVSSGWLRMVRQGGNFSTYYWQDCQWNRLDRFAETFSGPVYLGAQIDNQCEDAQSNGSLLVNFTWEDVRTGPGKNWTPPDCRLLEAAPLPAGLKVPDGLEAQMLKAPFDLGKLFFGHDGTAYIFSSQISNGWMTSRYFDGHYGLDKMKLLALYLNGTSSTLIESPLLGGTNMKSGVELYTGFLLALDYWPDGGSLFGGLYELRPDGGYSKWNLSRDYSGLGDVIPAPDEGWYFSDFKADNVWHLPAKGKAEEPLITQGDIPRGLVDLAFDDAKGTLYALSWGGSNPYGSALEVYRIEDDGQAILVAKVNESSTSPGGSIAISQGGSFERGVYVSDPEGGTIFRVDDDGTLTPEMTGLFRPGDMSFNPVTGDLLVVCNERYLLKVGGIEWLVRGLEDEDSSVRRDAADVLGEIGDSRAVDPLIRTLSDANSSVRSRAAWALGKVGDPRAAGPLIQALNDSDSWVKLLAASALGEIGDTTAVGPLISDLNSTNSSVRRDAAWALGAIGDPRAVDPLILALKDEDSYVREAAAISLGELRDAKAVDTLVEALSDEDSAVRWQAAYSLGEIGDARAAEALIDKLDDEDIGFQARESLCRIGGPAVSPLIQALKSEDIEVKDEVSGILSIIGEPAIQDLAQSLKDNDSVVRQFAAWTLGSINDSKAVDPLIQALNDTNQSVRETAAWALRVIGDKAARQALEKLKSTSEEATVGGGEESRQ